MSRWNNTFRRIEIAFLVSFVGSYLLALAGIVLLYYNLPANDAAKTSWFPIILFDPFVLTVAFFFATLFALMVFGFFLSLTFLSTFFKQ